MKSAKKTRATLTLKVLRTEALTKHLQRVILAQNPDQPMSDSGFTDQYSKLLFARPGSEVHAPFDLAEVRERLPKEQWPLTRTYTIRKVSEREVWIDFVVHGDQGIAGVWAKNAQSGDTLTLLTPSGGYAPSEQANWYAFAGDESAIPAIAAGLEALPESARGWAVLEVADASSHLELTKPEGVELVWVERGPERTEDSELLNTAVRQQPWLGEGVQVFAHGERAAMKKLRKYFLNEQDVPRKDLSLSGYWAFGRIEDQFQAEKREPVGQIFEPEPTV